jgi:hypothetical protein
MNDLGEEFLESVANNLDVCLLCELLNITPEDILDRFEDKVLDNMHLFEGWDNEEEEDTPD